VKTTQEVAVADVFTIIDACNTHGHTPAFLEVTMSAWRSLALDIYPPREHAPHMLNDDCADASCAALRRAMRVKPGDEPGTLVGVPVRIVADPPPPIIAVHAEGWQQEHIA